MYKLITGFVVLGLIFVIIDAIIVGMGGPNATRLTANLTDVATTITVSSTDGFLVSDYVRIGDELISYNGKTATTFTNCVRGYSNTEATAHLYGSKVYNDGTDFINAGLGFNAVSTGASAGEINILTSVIRFVTTTVPKLVSWNYSFLKEGLWQFARLLLFAISLAFVVVVGWEQAAALGGVLRSIFVR